LCAGTLPPGQHAIAGLGLRGYWIDQVEIIQQGSERRVAAYASRADDEAWLRHRRGSVFKQVCLRKVAGLQVLGGQDQLWTRGPVDFELGVVPDDGAL